MTDREKVLKGLECCCDMSCYECRKCPYRNECIGTDQLYGEGHLCGDALEQIQAYQQLLDWAVECDFGYDNIPPELYEQYKDKVERMGYMDGLLYLASRSLNKEG